MQEESTSTPILSISLLSSGRKETIWKCLDSLQPIREALATELIIVDTGCEEETHQQMLAYTNQVIRFTWCNDFSKARNAGLKLARGEWFLFIDDDEWFTDVGELIDFFQTGEYKKYGYANYIQRNYTDKSGKVYKDCWVSRMIRLDKDTRFVSSIHEYLYPVKGRCKLLHCPADHYGYVFRDAQEKYAHSKRNVSLLLDMLKKEPEHLRWWIQLAQEYLGIQEFSKLEELCEDGLEKFKRKNQADVNRQRGTFYAGLIIVEMYRRDYERAQERYLSAIRDERNTKVCRARLYCFGAEIYYKLKKDRECADCCRRYLKIYEELADKEMELVWQTSFFVREAFEEEKRNNVYGFYIASTLHQGDSSILREYFYRFDWKAPHLQLYILTPGDIIEGMAKLPYEEAFVDMAAVMMERKGVDNRVIQTIKKIETKKKEDYCAGEGETGVQLEAKKTEGFIRLCRIFSQIESSGHYYIWYMKLHYADFSQEISALDGIYKRLLGRVINLWDLDPSVFVIALKYRVKLEPIFSGVKFDAWKKGVDLLYEKGKKEKIELGKQVLDELCQGENIRFSYFYMKYAESLLRWEKEELSYSKIRSQVQEFCCRYLDFYGKYFKQEAFLGEMEMLPSACRLAVRLNRVLEEEAAGRIGEMKEALKSCFKLYPPMDKRLRLFAKLYAENRKREYGEMDEARAEMKELAVKIKLRVEELLNQRMYAEAYGIWQQLLSLMPEDGELLLLAERIKGGLS